MNVLAVLLVGELLGAEAAAHEALLVALACLLARHGELVDTGSVAGAVVGRGDARVLAGEAAEVHLVTLGGSTRGEAEVDAATAGGDGDLVDLGVDEWALIREAAAEVGRGVGGPVRVLGGARRLGEKDQGCFKVVGGDGLGQGGNTLDKSLKSFGVLHGS